MNRGINIASVQFEKAGRLFDFRYIDLEIQVGDAVVVETERGLSLADVVKLGFHIPTEEGHSLKPILRKATKKESSQPAYPSPQDITQLAEERIKKYKLKMRILKAELQFGGSKVLVYFSAPSRVDFRDLVKDLAGSLKARVELKQVGARDETKLLGGIGICGREYCCSSFLREFIPISIKMAKNQNLALNPSKISGGCGRLLCCLTYENDAYTESRRTLPTRDSLVKILDTQEIARVIKSDFLNQKLLLEKKDGTQVSCLAQEVSLELSKEEKEKVEILGEDEWGADLDLQELREHL